MRRKRMDLTRRGFLKVSGAATAGIAMTGLGLDLSPVQAMTWELRTKNAKETPTVC
ncbi:MAG: twin-arginine translocation signal domain-containing protein, partial [Acidobacteriota bacterium]